MNLVPSPIIGYVLIWSSLIFSKCETSPPNNRLCSDLVLSINLNFLVCDLTRSQLFWSIEFGLNLLWLDLNTHLNHESDKRTSLGLNHFSQENTPETESQPHMNKYGRGPVPGEEEMSMSHLELNRIIT